MDNRKKMITILVCFLLLVFLAGINAFGGGQGDRGILTADDLAGKPLGGIEGRMPDNSAKIFFESLTGRKLSSYTSYRSADEAVSALDSGKVSAVAVCDVTADYLMNVRDGLTTLDVSQMAAIENMEEPRFYFGFAAVNDKAGRELADELNGALAVLREDGVLDTLYGLFVDPETAYYAQGNLLRDKQLRNAMSEVARIAESYAEGNRSSGQKTLRIGVTGTTPPIDLIGPSGEPEGYSVALTELLGAVLGRKVMLIVQGSETLFSGLQSGKTDLVFAYGAGNITTEGTKTWVMTEGYAPMQRYEFLVLEGEQ